MDEIHFETTLWVSHSGDDCLLIQDNVVPKLIMFILTKGKLNNFFTQGNFTSKEYWKFSNWQEWRGGGGGGRARGVE